MQKITQILSLTGFLFGITLTGCAQDPILLGPDTPIKALTTEDVTATEDALMVPLTGTEIQEAILNEADAREIVETLYPNTPWDKQLMFGPQDDVDGTWYPAWMASAIVGTDVRQIVISAVDGTVLIDETLEDFASPSVAARTLTNTTRYSQRDARWTNSLLGNSTSDTIGNYGCVITTVAMWYGNYLGHTTDTPQVVNDWGKANGCFSAGSSLVNVSCIVDKYGAYTASAVSLANLATTISTSGKPIFFYRVYGAGYHMVYGYAYNGGVTTATSSYTIIDAWDGTSKSLTAYPTASPSNPYRTP